MYKNLIKTSTVDMSYNDWLLFRKQGIGASEVSAIMGHNDYMHAIEVFYDKINPNIIHKSDNLAMYYGRDLEDNVSRSYRFYENSVELMMKNAAENKIINDVFRSNMYIQNPNFPHLFVSLDRRIKGKNGALECKTMSGFVWRRGEKQVPTSYLFQAIQQAGVCGFDFIDIAILIDGRYFEVFTIDFNESLFEGIVEHTSIFWEKVKEGKVLNSMKFEAENNFNSKLVKEINAKLMRLEPEPTASMSYSEFITDQYSFGEGGKIEGSLEMLEIAKSHKKTKENIKLLNQNAVYYENIIKRKLEDNSILDFGKDGSVTWIMDKNNKRIFRNKIK